MNALNLSLLTLFLWEMTAPDVCCSTGIVLEMSFSKMGFLKTSALMLNVSEVNVGTIEKTSPGYYGCSFRHGGDVADGVGLFVECYRYCSCSYYCAILLDL